MPKRSATAPANGAPTPQSKFWIAMARLNTSRPQPYSATMGNWNSPAAARGPKVMRAMRHPAPTTSSGETRLAEAGMGVGPYEPKRGHHCEAFAGSGQSGYIPAYVEHTRWPENIKGAVERSRRSVEFGWPRSHRAVGYRFSETFCRNSAARKR